jgi:hypothetical protein
MTRIRGEVTIEAPVEDVFDLVADERNEPSYNPRIAHAEKVGDGPVGPGTTFVVEPRGVGRRGRMTVEVVEHDRPHRLRNVVRSSYSEVDGVLTFAPVEGGTRFGWDWEMTLLGPSRLLTPVLRAVGPRWERRNWLDLKAWVEQRRHVLEVHLEELGQHSWWKALLNTLVGLYGSAQFRFVARPPGPDDTGDHHVLGATFPMMRLQDLDDQTEPNAWIDTARERLDELDEQLVRDGWHRTGTTGRHWWSRTYAHPLAPGSGEDRDDR